MAGKNSSKLESIDFESSNYKGSFKGNLVRTLTSKGITTYQSLVSYSRHELLSMNGIGTMAMMALIKDLEERGYRLRGE